MKRTQTTLSTMMVALLSAYSSARCESPADTRSRHLPIAPNIATHHTSRFVLHTDLRESEAKRILTRMESTLQFAEHYWDRPSQGRIRCYLVGQLSAWPEDALPHPLARIWIDWIGGAAIGEHLAGRPGRRQATIYTSTRPRVAQHEVIHAYCLQTFGATGPDWYKEGMAEMATFRADRQHGLQCSQEMLDALRAQPGRTVQEIVAGPAITKSTNRSLDAMLNDRADRSLSVPLSAWTAHDSASLYRAKSEYYLSGALCHLLMHNPNYRKRFRLLGDRYLAGDNDCFDRLFQAAEEKIAFELEFFLDHAEPGYRVDLCAWEWDKAFRTLPPGRSLGRSVSAARGYQATGLEVAAHQTYAYRTSGAWSTRSEGSATGANGRPDGTGVLVGIIMRSYQLSAPFELGAAGTFSPPIDGRLYVRCRDAFTALSDNRGSVTVHFTRASADGD